MAHPPPGPQMAVLSSDTTADIEQLGGSALDDEQMNRRVRVQVTANPDSYLYAW